MRYFTVLCLVVVAVAFANAVPLDAFRSLLRSRTVPGQKTDVSAILQQLRSKLQEAKERRGQTGAFGKSEAKAETSKLLDVLKQKLANPQARASKTGQLLQGKRSEECTNTCLGKVGDEYAECAIGVIVGTEVEIMIQYAIRTGKPLFTEDEYGYIWSARTALHEYCVCGGLPFEEDVEDTAVERITAAIEDGSIQESAEDVMQWLEEKTCEYSLIKEAHFDFHECVEEEEKRKK